MPSKILSLSAFNRRISGLINGRAEVSEIWVAAELSDFRKSGPHAYGTLIEKDTSGQTIASIRATIWGRNLEYIKQKFLASTGQHLRGGMKVSICMTASHHPAYGLSANITDIDPAYSLGDLERIRREILSQLEQLGIIDENKTLEMPEAPQRIAIISAENAAGYGDFIQQLQSSPYIFYTSLFPSLMQGENTASGVIAALDVIEENIDFWDCVVIIRGGGGANDLTGFDNLELAKRVATYPLPVIVGIGHERDNTVLDYIAHTRCKTPTAVAALLIETLTLAERRSEDLGRKIFDYTRLAISGEKERLALIEARLPLTGPARIDREKGRLHKLGVALADLAREKTKINERILINMMASLSAAKAFIIGKVSVRLDSITEKIRIGSSTRIANAFERVVNMENIIEILNPQATLKRGYSITRIDGSAIKSVDELSPDAEIETQLADGKIKSYIKNEFHE